MFMVTMGRLGFNPSNVTFLCETCWPEWCIVQARFGFDLHFHGVAMKCDSRCLAKQNGRFLQFVVRQTIDRSIGYRMIKLIDGRPRVIGSELVMGARLEHFRGGELERQTFYEAIPNADDLVSQLIRAKRLPFSNHPPVRGDSFLLAVEIFESAHVVRDGTFRHPAANEKTLNLHAVAVEDYDESTGMFVFWNSWGSHWGKRGYGQMSLQYARDYFHDAIVIRYARWGPTPYKVPRLCEGINSKEYRRLWAIENPRTIQRIPGAGNKRWRRRRYESISPVTDEPVVCLEVTTGYGLVVGWTFLRHRFGPEAITEVTEFYVWPTYRRLGIGRRLESWIVEEAESRNSVEIHLILNEADAVVGPLRYAARTFALDVGYSFRWRTRTGPRSPATAIKSLFRTST